MRLGIVSSGRIVSASLRSIARGSSLASSAKTWRCFGDGARQRLEELAGGQDHVLRHAAAFLSGGVSGDKRDADALAGKRVFAQIAARQPLGLARVALGQVEPVFRQRIKRMGARLGLSSGLISAQAS